jgi:DNA-binding MarR family transcriptional regulator
MDQRHQDLIYYLIDSPWQKNEIVALIAEKSDVTKRTARNRLEDAEEEGFVDMIKLSRNRVFVKRDNGRELPIDFKVKNEAEVHSSLEKSHHLINDVIRQTFPFQSRGNGTSHSVLRSNISRILSGFHTNAIPPRKLNELENTVQELDELCRDQFVVVYDEPYIDYVFEILDDIIFLWENYDNIETTEDHANYVTQTADPTDMSRIYLSFLSKMSLNATTVGYRKAYNSRLSERVSRLRPLIETVPTPVADEIYYIMQSHGSVTQRIDAFIAKIRSQDGDNYYQFLGDAYSFYDDEERQRLRTRLRDIADDLDGQQRTLVERLCFELDGYRSISHNKTKLRYYNKTKKKIIAVLAHGPEKLGNIARYSGESKSNILSNIDKLSDDGFVKTVEDRHGYYKLDEKTEGLFEARQNQKPVADRAEVKKTLKRIANWREEHVYPEGARIHDEDERLLQRMQDPPWLALVDLVLDCSFVLEKSEEVDLFFNILDNDLEKLRRRDANRLSIPDEILTLWGIAGLLHQQWKKGLENIRYHSELSKRIDDLKEVHGCVPPSERKHIRNLVSVVDFEAADDLFRQAVSDNKEPTDDLKESIRDIYYHNPEMDTVVDFLSSSQERSPANRDGLQAELLDYAVNLPYKRG